MNEAESLGKGFSAVSSITLKFTTPDCTLLFVRHQMFLISSKFMTFSRCFI